MSKIILAGSIILKDGSVLLLHRIKTDWYELPGGKVNRLEMPQEAAKRELKEELLCDIEIIKEVGKKDFEEDGKVYEYVWFLAKIKNGQVPKIGEMDKFDHFKYISKDKLISHKLSPNMLNLEFMLPKILKNLHS